ncbi:MAG: hypothetical protein AAGF85_09125 [Bacteroidota bacterium]
MKIRIKGNTLRLRLTQTEVSLMLSKGYVQDIIELASSKLAYELVRTNGTDVHADFRDNVITVRVPVDVIHNWGNTELVGFEANQEVSDGKTLSILVEKDFKCRIDRGEDESDLYDPPTN